MSVQAQSRLAATAVRVATSREWTPRRATWALHCVAGRDRWAAERALVEVARLNAGAPSPALTRALEALEEVYEDLAP